MTAFLSPDPALTTRRQNHMRAWAQRQRDSYAAAVADLKARGVTALMCPDCGYRHGLGMIGALCNAHTDWGVCDSTAPLIEVAPTLSLSNGLGGLAAVRYSVTGGRA